MSSRVEGTDVSILKHGDRSTGIYIAVARCTEQESDIYPHFGRAGVASSRSPNLTDPPLVDHHELVHLRAFRLYPKAEVRRGIFGLCLDCYIMEDFPMMLTIYNLLTH